MLLNAVILEVPSHIQGTSGSDGVSFWKYSFDNIFQRPILSHYLVHIRNQGINEI